MSIVRSQLLGAGDPAWDDWLTDVPHDIYHTAGYHSYSRGTGEGEPFMLVVGDQRRGLAWPYLLRQVSEVEHLAGSLATDVTSVYGYSGPLAWGCAPGDPFFAQAWSEVLGAWLSQGVVSAFTRFHPLLGNESLMSGLRAPRDEPVDREPVSTIGRTVSIDLTIGEDAARAGYSESLRRQIRNYRAAGLVTTLDEDWTDIGTFARIYHETMARNGAADYYFFDKSDFLRLRESVDGRVFLFVTRLGDTVGAAGLFTEYRGIVQEHLVAASQSLAYISPYKVLIDDACAWARQRGNSVFHLGGGRGAHEDSLFDFKSRFSPRRHPFYTGRWVLDPAACRELLEARGRGADGEGAGDSDYFPPYRAPVVESRRPSPSGSATGVRSSRGPALPARTAGSVEFRSITSRDADALADLFADIDETFFRPHPFTAEEARRIASLEGRDHYALMFVDERPVAYGMLRGWDEGFETPSLGIAVRTREQRRGYGRLMMDHLRATAMARGAGMVRLRVHRDNERARRLYESLGYRYMGEDRGELVMVLEIGETAGDTGADGRGVAP
jgi:ribosomal protein S18 acetylase RimI-like enzyme